MTSCVSQPVRLSFVEPGHFHASLVLKYDLQGVDRDVRVYAPEGPELESYLAAARGFNTREDSPTHWNLSVCDGPLPPAEGREAVVLAGNNIHKTALILDAVQKGYHVLADKPLIVDYAQMPLLEQAFRTAADKGLVIQELMTERSYPLVFSLQAAPAVSIRSVHHFYKTSAGVPVRRPVWYYDIRCQGEGIADVTTHYIDMIFASCFPGQEISPGDIVVESASHWPTLITPEQFTLSTGVPAYPESLKPFIINGMLAVMANGTITFRVKGILFSIEVIWEFEGTDSFDARWEGYEGPMPKDEMSHEDRFNLVMKDFLSYVRGEKAQPAFEAANTLAKYKLLEKAVALANAQ